MAESKENSELSRLWGKLNHQFNVVRREAITDIVQLVSCYGDEQDSALKSQVQADLVKLISSDRREQRQAGFLLAKHFFIDNSEFCDVMLTLARENLLDKESTVREAIAEMVEELAKVQGLSLYRALKPDLFKIIEDNFVEAEAPEDSTKVVAASIQREKRILQEKLKGIKDGMDSWKLLFSAFKTVEKLVWGLGPTFEPELDDAFFHLVHRCTKHINRFIREGAFNTYGAIILTLSPAGFEKFGDRIAQELKLGLGDNWSQVRHAASIATRHFFQQVPDGKKYYGTLLPAMCLNRYYVAAGVRVYSQETWKIVFGETGKELVAQYSTEVTTYYIEQAQADNHAVREAACHCIAELGNKIQEDALSAHIPQLLDTLIGCFKDESWPVRDSACLALGNFVTKFPKESANDLEELYALWFEHLSDNIPSVRADSAVALGKVLKAFGDPAFQKMKPMADAFLTMVNNQASETKMYGQLENTTLFGVAAKRKRDNDPQLHTGQAQYSCGSLAPKMKKSARCGCMDHGFAREREQWEYTDGAVHLTAELVAFKPELGLHYLTKIAEIGRIRHFGHYNKLQETLWTTVPKIAKAMGVGEFKHALDESMILQPVVDCLEEGTMLSKATAGSCLSFFYQFLGDSIFDARLNERQKEVVHNSAHVSRRQLQDYSLPTPGWIQALQETQGRASD